MYEAEQPTGPSWRNHLGLKRPEQRPSILNIQIETKDHVNSSEFKINPSQYNAFLYGKKVFREHGICSLKKDCATPGGFVRGMTL